MLTKLKEVSEEISTMLARKCQSNLQLTWHINSVRTELIGRVGHAMEAIRVNFHRPSPQPETIKVVGTRSAVVNSRIIILFTLKNIASTRTAIFTICCRSRVLSGTHLAKSSRRLLNHSLRPAPELEARQATVSAVSAPQHQAPELEARRATVSTGSAL